MIYAVYRILYGEDFIIESIDSIYDYVDKIFIFWTTKVWGGVTECYFKGKQIVFPDKFDDVIELVKSKNYDKVILVEDYVADNMNQFTHLVNDLILPNYEMPNTIMFIEPDHVFREDQIKNVIDEFQQTNLLCAGTNQIELWRYPNFRIPPRDRLSVVLWNLDLINRIPATYRHANPIWGNVPKLNSFVFNLGFCLSEENMYWKHIISLGFSQKIGDSIPNEDWYSSKWLSWDLETNNQELEISEGYEFMIPYAEPYDLSELPECLRKRLSSQ